MKASCRNETEWILLVNKTIFESNCSDNILSIAYGYVDM